MSNPAVEPKDEVVEALLARRNSAEELKRLIALGRAHSGRLVDVVSWDDGDICPRFKFPWPPPPKFGDFVVDALRQNSRFRVFPIGIPNPEELFVDLAGRGAGR